MANGTQPLFPVYLPRPIQSGEDKQTYETAIAQNENCLNQDLSILYEKIVELENRLSSLGG